MAKLNKTQLTNTVTEMVQTLIADNADLFKKGKEAEMSTILTTALYEVLGPKTGGGSLDKVNDEGLVYCNYFDTYLPAEDFNSKTNGKFKANSIEAEKILRRVKTIRNSITREATAQFRAGVITEEKWMETMNALDAFASAKYDTVEAVKWAGDTAEDAE